ncbi:MAG TPA: hypothetical protein VFQ65_12450 [Kofleriaceae bacterium]|nr:hypothetical protein [Kofleriaceae bacterium]
MGSYAFLDSFEHIDRILSARAHQVEAKIYIPIYWLAMFDSADIRTEPLTGVRYAKSPDKHFVVAPPYLVVEATIAMGRLKRRTPALATLGGEAHRKMLTEFGAFARRLKPSSMVRLDDLLMGTPMPAYVEQLRGTLELCKKLDDATVHPDSYLIEPLSKVWAGPDWKASEHQENLLSGWGWRVSPEERAKNSSARKWNKLVGENPTNMIEYTVNRAFTADEVLAHPKLGAGVVTRVVDANKIEVLFREGLRTLVHGRR